jgi:hypothetical protein
MLTARVGVSGPGPHAPSYLILEEIFRPSTLLSFLFLSLVQC